LRAFCAASETLVIIPLKAPEILGNVAETITTTITTPVEGTPTNNAGVEQKLTSEQKAILDAQKQLDSLVNDSFIPTFGVKFESVSAYFELSAKVFHQYPRAGEFHEVPSEYINAFDPPYLHY